MPTLTVRDIDEKTMRRLRALARANNRSVSAEVRHLLATTLPGLPAETPKDAAAE